MSTLERKQIFFYLKAAVLIKASWSTYIIRYRSYTTVDTVLFQKRLHNFSLCLVQTRMAGVGMKLYKTRRMLNAAR